MTRTVSSPPSFSEATAAFEAFIQALERRCRSARGGAGTRIPAGSGPIRPPREVASVVVPAAPVRALQVAHAHRVDDDLHPRDLDDLVTVGRLVQDHPVREAGAAPALDIDPQSALGDVGLLLLQDSLDFFRRRRGEVDHAEPPLKLDRTGKTPGCEARNRA